MCVCVHKCLSERRMAVRLMLRFTIQTIRLGVDYGDDLDSEKLTPNCRTLHHKGTSDLQTSCVIL